MRRVVGSRTFRGVLTAAVVVVIFAGVLPRMADYDRAWALARSLTATEASLVAVVATVNLVSYAPLWMAAIPGLTLGRAVLSDTAATAVANTVPVGFAFGLGTTVTMLHSYGCSAAAITRGITLTGVWNNLVKLAVPAVALVGLAVVSDAAPGLTAAAILGTGLLGLAIAVLVLVLTSPRSAAVLAGGAQRAAARLLRGLHRPAPTGWPAATERFRRDSLGLVRVRWPHLTAAAVASHAALFLLLLVCVRTVGGAAADIAWPAVLAVFSLTRLVTMVPITPGALGVAELSYVAGLTTAGVEAAAAAGAVLVFRFLTWFVPIPLGAAAWVLWRRGVGRTVLPAAVAR